jgi:hypothetical protein
MDIEDEAFEQVPRLGVASWWLLASGHGLGRAEASGRSVPRHKNQELEAGRALLAGEEIVSDEAIPAVGNAMAKLPEMDSNIWQLGQKNFPQFAAPNSAGVRVFDGKIHSVAIYNPFGEIAGRLDFFSRTGRVDHPFPHFHIPNPGWPGIIIPGIPEQLPVHLPISSP